MNNKQKEIEEFARDIGESLGITYEGEQLPFRLKTRNYLAEKLVNKNYRKIPEDSVAITKEELKKIIQEEYQNALKDKVVLSREEFDEFRKDRAEVIFLKKQITEQARKETAREFAEKLKKKLYTNNYCQEIVTKEMIQELEKQYGVIGEE